MNICVDDQEQPQYTDQQTKLLLKVIQDFRFVQQLKSFTESDLIELLKCFYFVRLKPGQRVYDKGDKIDKFVLILSGKIGIYYLELAKLKQAAKIPGRVVLCCQQDIKKRKQARDSKKSSHNLPVNAVVQTTT